MLGFTMSPRRNPKKSGNLKGLKNVSSDESDETRTPTDAKQMKNLRNGKDDVNEKCCALWLKFSQEIRKEREHCITISALSSFLYGVVPSGLEDKLIDWSHECGLLEDTDIQQVFPTSDKRFVNIKVIENALSVVSSYWVSEKGIRDILELKDAFMKKSSAQSAIECAKTTEWFRNLRSKLKVMPMLKKESGDMSLLLVIYFFAVHVQSVMSDDTDLFKKYERDCGLSAEKDGDKAKQWSEFKNDGNKEFDRDSYRSAITCYSKAAVFSPFNYIVYGNRSMSYLRLKNYRQALLDAKRAIVLKPDWDKGRYRFDQAVKALSQNEGTNEYLSYFLQGQTQPDEIKENFSYLRQNGITHDDDNDSLPDLVSAGDSDTSTDSEHFEQNAEESIMPELVEDLSEESDSDDDDDSDDEDHLFDSGRARAKMRKKKKKVITRIIEDQQARKEEEVRKEEEAKMMAQKEAERQKEKSKVAKPKKAKEATLVDDLIPLSERKNQINEILREATKALIHSSFEQASDRYSRALGIIDAGPRKSLEFGDKSYVVVLYAYGTALLGVGIPKQIEAARSMFENIINLLEDFPLAYYGLGRVYYQENRFQEAVTSLEEGLQIIDKLSFEPIYWPGTDLMIEEAKEKSMKAAFEKNINLCKFPPSPDATCRSDTCTKLKKYIYLNDPDYKGYVRFFCNDACIIDYHVQCWKKLKSLYFDKSTEKDFLDSECFTLDCCGHIIKIQINDVNGLKDELQSQKLKQSVATVGSKKKKKKKKDNKSNIAEEMNNGDTPRSGQKTEELKPAIPIPDGKKPVPEAKKTVPEAKTPVPEVKKPVPEAKKPVPEAKKSVPEVKKPVPEVKKPVPEAKKSVPEAQKSVPEATKPVPDGKKHVPEAKKNVPDEKTPVPNDKKIVPEATTPVPDGKKHVPEAKKTVPDEKPAEPVKEEIVQEVEAVNSEDAPKFPDIGMLLRKKTDNEPVSQVKQSKGKPKKKKKNVQSLDEFLGRDSERYRQRPTVYDGEDYDEIPSQPFSSVAPAGWMADNPFHIPAHLQDEALEIESAVRSHSQSSNNEGMYSGSDPWQMDSIREYVSSSFIQLLKVRGPLHVDSDIMKGNLKVLPEEAQKLVEDDGGLLEFLTKSNLFTIEKGFVTNLEEKLFTDLSKSHKKTCESEPNNSILSDDGKTTLNDNTDSSMSSIDPIHSDDSVSISYRTVTLINNPPTERKLHKKLETCDSVSESMYSLSVIELSSTTGQSNQDRKSPLTEDTNSTDRKEKSNNITDGCIQNKQQDPEEAKDAHCTINVEYMKDLDMEKVDKILSDPRYSTPSILLNNQEPSQPDSSTQNVVNSSSSCSKEKLESDQNNGFNNSSISMVTEKNVVSQCTQTSKNIQTESRNTNKQQTKIQPSTVITPTTVDVKTTKDKGILAKATVKNKLVMTEPIVETYKAEYEKLLNTSGALDIKRQEALEKTEKLHKTQCQQILNMNKKLQELEKQSLNQDTKLEMVECRYQQEVHSLHEERNKRDKQIKELQQQLITQTEADEMRIEVLKQELATLESSSRKEKEQLETEKKQVEKFKTFSQQQAQRACHAEVKLLEVQRDVSLNFYKRTIQESEITIHHISQMAVINPTQLHEMSQKWQRYIDECKQQMNLNSAQFATSICLVKEGQPLVSLNLHIHRPGPYPGPPVLHMPPGVVPPGQKPPTPGPEAPAPVPVLGKQNPAAATAIATATATVVRPEAPSTIPQTQAVPKMGENAAGVTKSTEQPQKASNSFEKIMLRLLSLFPNYSRVQITNFIKEVRASKNGSLTGLSFDDIVKCVTELVKIRESQTLQTTAAGASNDISVQAAGAVSVASKPGTFGVLDQSSLDPNQATGPVSPSSQVLYEDDPCVICHDEMTPFTTNVVLECNHKFHHGCIKKWLVGEQSTCPTCRVHTLLPDEFPKLK